MLHSDSSNAGYLGLWRNEHNGLGTDTLISQSDLIEEVDKDDSLVFDGLKKAVSGVRQSGKKTVLSRYSKRERLVLKWPPPRKRYRLASAKRLTRW